MAARPITEPAPVSRPPAVLRSANRLAIDLLSRASSAAISSRLPLFRPMALLGQAQRVGTANVRGTKLRLLIDDYCDYGVLKHWSEVEPETLDWIDALPAGASLLDIGSNVGRFALYAAARHRGRVSVAAVDPDLRVSQRLAKSITLNKLEGRIQNVVVGASDKDGHERMVFNYRVQQGHLGGGSAVTERETYAYTIQTMRIDSMVEQRIIEPPTHIKIDVDGHEIHVLDGAAATLRSPQMRSVLIEVDGETKARVQQQLADAGYVFRSSATLTSGLENLIYDRID